MDVVIADIEADRLPLPIGKNAYIKEVMGASLLGQLLLAIIVHAEDKETEQLRQTAAEHIETKVHLKAIAKVGERIFPERGVFVCAIDNAWHLVKAGMVNRRGCQQAEQLYGLNGQ